jgi:hypothetical protein
LATTIQNGNPNTLVVTNGNVGINISNPGYPFIVSDNTTLPLAVFSQTSGGTYAALGLNTPSGSWNISEDNDGTKIYFCTGLTLGANRLIAIQSNGNVGIGTLSPKNSLDVIGNGSFSGTVAATNGFLGNGFGLTNVATCYYTNITSSITNLNLTTKVMSWKVPVIVTQPASTLGSAEVDAQYQRADGVWITLADLDIAGGATSVLFTNKSTLIFDIPSGYSYRITNNISGTGYTAGLDSTKTNTVTFY